MAERVALFTQNLSGGGAERIMVQLANGLAETGLDVDLVLCQAEGPYAKLVSPKVRTVDLKSPVEILSLGPFRKYLRENQPKAVLSALNQPNSVALLARKRGGPRTVISIHNTLSQEVESSRSLKMRIVPVFVRALTRHADAIVAVSDGVADDFATFARIPRDRVTKIVNPVVLPELFDQAAAPLDDPWFAPGAPPVVIGVGRLNAQKNFGNLLAAFARVPAPARLIVLGEGEERAALEAETARLGLQERVRWPGFVDNPFRYLSRARLLALSSDFEGLPTALIEALACGTPVVSTDCPSGPREILAGGRYGRLVPVRDPVSLGDAINSLLATSEIKPPAESWEPYVASRVVERYREILLPG
ncbi:glycosyltransferase [bacterium]|nr:MAG: glycosyltransferase [bacterium]